MAMDPFEAALKDPEDFQEDTMDTQSPTSTAAEPVAVPGTNVSNPNNEDEKEEEENMDLLLTITGMRNVSEPMIVAVSATSKMFVGEIVETDICNLIHVAFRRLRLEGKVPTRSVPRLFL
ncbi:TAFII28-like protein [Parasponia andersonii]|uniref:TAFII28-like protein n=1 Tax=Parasponia andersonii TaxID=3476 RepID=A0A2P5B7H7_PARAD|nr:TAFII28-like protein [Parasponia andersonii]